jgi:hypothetical protein
MNKDKVLEIAKECGFSVREGLLELCEMSDYTATVALESFATAILSEKQEPVAWMWDDNGVTNYSDDFELVEYYQSKHLVSTTPLYTRE